MRTRVHDYVLEKRVNVVMEIRDGRVMMMMMMANLDIASGGCIFKVVYNLIQLTLPLTLTFASPPPFSFLFFAVGR